MRTSIVSALLLALCLGTANAAEEQPPAIEVVVSGMGRDSDSALKNAFKTAVQQAVGSIIDSKTLVENDEVVSDRILSHSGGYVTDYEMIGEPKNEDGLVSVRIKAQVARKQLMAKMAEEGLILQESSSESFDIKAEVFTKSQDNRSAKEMFAEQIKGYPENFVKLKYVSSKPGEKEGEFWVDVEVSSDPNELKAFHTDLRSLLDRVAEAPAVDVRYKMGWYNSGTLLQLNRSGEEGFALRSTPTIAVPVRTNAERTLGAWKRYTVSEELFESIKTGVSWEKLIMRITLLDASNSVLREKTFIFPIPYTYEYQCFAFYDVLAKNGTLEQLTPGVTSTVLHYKFDDLFLEEIEEIAKVKVTMEKR